MSLFNLEEWGLVSMWRRWLLFILSLFLLALVACSALVDEPLVPRNPTETADNSIPTRMSVDFDYDAAEHTLTRFLDAWQDNDYVTMYASLTPRQREILSFSAFRANYLDAAQTLKLKSLDYQLLAMAPNGEGNGSLLATYSVTFHSHIAGSFTDEARQLTLLEMDGGQWAIEWSPGLIFAELDEGARLRILITDTGRQSIYARDGSILADQGGLLIRVQVVPREIPNLKKCLSALALVSSRDEEAMRAQIIRSPEHWLLDIAKINGDLYANSKEAIDETLSTDCAARLDTQSTRRYPDGRLAPHVVGYVGLPSADELEELTLRGLNAESIIGRSSVEANWDAALQGKAGGELLLVSATGETLRKLSAQGPSPAQSVWLTIQPGLQAHVRRVLHEAYDSGQIDKGSSGAAAIVMDVQSGAIHALVSYPDFDINALSPFSNLSEDEVAAARAELADPRRPEFNRATQGLYPAGSVFKPVTYLAALDSGLYSLEHGYFCNGTWSRPQEGIIRTDWLKEGHGRVNTHTAIPLSCNPYFYESGFDLNQADPFRLPQYARRLGLGLPTGIEDIDEAAGAIGDPDIVRSQRGYVWSFSDAVSMAIGQGFVSITPLQITRMYASFANGGRLLQPQLVWKSGLPGDQPSHLLEPIVQSELNMSPEAFTRLQQSLCDVADTWYGTARLPFSGSPLLEDGVCGKTGTAQDLRPGDRLPHAWFVGYAPAANPEIVVTVMVENSGEGSVVSAPLVREIMEYYFSDRP